MIVIQVWSKCERCGRMFYPKTKGQRYGPKCARKIQEYQDDLGLKAAQKAGELDPEVIS